MVCKIATHTDNSESILVTPSIGFNDTNRNPGTDAVARAVHLTGKDAGLLGRPDQGRIVPRIPSAISVFFLDGSVDLTSSQ